MYRAMTFKVLKAGIDLMDEARVSALAASTEIRLQRSGTQLRVTLDGKDVTTSIRRPEVTAAVSAVSAIGSVREVMVREQQKIGKDGGVVLEGRDIGTVVFPDADLKIFMVADVAQRAERRRKELHDAGIDVDAGTLARELAERDRKDSQRNISPLRKADNAIVLDTTTMTIEQQVEAIIGHAEALLRRDR